MSNDTNTGPSVLTGILFIPRTRPRLVTMCQLRSTIPTTASDILCPRPQSSLRESPRPRRRARDIISVMTHASPSLIAFSAAPRSPCTKRKPGSRSLAIKSALRYDFPRFSSVALAKEDSPFPNLLQRVDIDLQRLKLRYPPNARQRL